MSQNGPLTYSMTAGLMSGLMSSGLYPLPKKEEPTMAYLRSIRSSIEGGCCGAAEMQQLNRGIIPEIIKQARDMRVGFIIAWFWDNQLGTPFAKDLEAYGFKFGERFKNPNSGNWLTTCTYTLTEKDLRGY